LPCPLCSILGWSPCWKQLVPAWRKGIEVHKHTANTGFSCLPLGTLKYGLKVAPALKPDIRTHHRSPAGGAPTPTGPQYVLSGEIQDFTPEDNADFYAAFADVDDRGIVSNLLGPDGLPGARFLRPAWMSQVQHHRHCQVHGSWSSLRIRVESAIGLRWG